MNAPAMVFKVTNAALEADCGPVLVRKTPRNDKQPLFLRANGFRSWIHRSWYLPLDCSEHGSRLDEHVLTSAEAKYGV